MATTGMASLMGMFEERMRAVERSVARLTGGRSKALAFRKRLETTIRQASTQTEPDIVQRLIKAGRAAWINDPDRNDSVLVERGTGCVLEDSRGQVFRGPKLSLAPTPPLDKGAFVEYLKEPGIEGYVPHMYLDSRDNVTVGIGLLLRDAETAKTVPFVVRSTNQRAHKRHIENAFNKVKNAKISGRAGAAAFRPLTNIEIPEAEAALRALGGIDDFLRQLSSSSFYPEFASYPQTAKLGLLDMAYVLGPTGTRDTYKKFTAALRRRNWKVAAKESNRPEVSGRRNTIVREWFERAATQERFFLDPACRPK